MADRCRPLDTTAERVGESDFIRREIIERESRIDRTDRQIYSNTNPLLYCELNATPLLCLPSVYYKCDGVLQMLQ